MTWPHAIGLGCVIAYDHHQTRTIWNASAPVRVAGVPHRARRTRPGSRLAPDYAHPVPRGGLVRVGGFAPGTRHAWAGNGPRCGIYRGPVRPTARPRRWQHADARHAGVAASGAW